jgi:NAD(P)H-flavin reductase
MSEATVPEPFRVAAVRQETDDTWTLDLEPTDGRTLEFAPGQFTMLYALGVGEVPISVSGDPSHPEQLVHTVRSVGPVTNAICEAQEDVELGVRGPFGRGWPVETAAGMDVVIVAGGVGLAPLRSLIYSVLGARERYGRLVLLYGGRTPDQLLYRGELADWAARDEIEVGLTVDAADTGWTGRVGVVPTLISRASLEPDSTIGMVCGPEVMMRFSVEALADSGVSPDRIYLSLERNMRCAVGHCGHCQWGPDFVCRDGPVFAWSHAAPWLKIREL